MVASVVLRSAIFGLLWVAMTEGDFTAAYLGAIVVAITVAVSLFLLPRGDVGASGLVPVIGLLARIPFASLTAGADVAARALRPSLPVRPGIVGVATRANVPGIQVAIAYLATIIPGSICVRMEPGRLRLHLIDRRQPSGEFLSRMEERLVRAWEISRHG